GYKTELKALEQQFETKSEKFETVSSERHELVTKLEKIDSEKNQLKDDIVKGYSQIDTLQHRVGILTKLLENYADYPEGVKHLMVDSNGYIGTVADKISVDAKYRTAIEAVLGEAATYLLVKDTNQAFVGIDNLKSNRKGIVTFLPLDKLESKSPVPAETNIGGDDKIIGPAKNIVRCEDTFEPLVTTLLRNFVVVEDLETARKQFEVSPDNALSFVTLSGEVLTSWGSIKGGQKTHDESGFVGRRDQVKKFKEKIGEIHAQMEKAENRMRELEQHQQGAEQKKSELDKKMIELEKEIADMKLHISQLQYKISQSDEQAGKIDAEIKQLSEEIETANSTIEQTLRQLEDETGEQEAKEEEVAESNKAIEEIAAKRDTLYEKVQQSRLKLVQLNSELKSKQNDLERSRQIIAESESSIKSKKDERTENSRQAEELGIRIEEITAALTEEYSKKEHIESDVSKIEDEQISLKEQIDEREKILRSLRSERESTSESIHHIDLRIAELKLNADNLYRHIGEEYNHDLQREKMDTEYDSQADEELIDSLKQRIKNLGPVNLLALKEYEQEKERFDFLQKQHDDLIEAKTNLTNTVDHINKTAREKFLDIYEKIRVNFGEVFNRFFSEGVADLNLTDKDDPLESDIEIMANPKSKRATSLSLLSGGEKALTAISLLFAIYLVKPSPFCILDEVDAPLDDNNIRRFTDALKMFSSDTQFLVVTHNKLTMKSANSLYGITMENSGVSKVVSVKLD
ncbi:chromosome segregation protein SMC, partial [candidate division KSB1 bacterium]|nr:chromosome segregation protein SMC [candidate division KSB1 bacterium]